MRASHCSSIRFITCGTIVGQQVAALDELVCGLARRRADSASRDGIALFDRAPRIAASLRARPSSRERNRGSEQVDELIGAADRGAAEVPAGVGRHRHERSPACARRRSSLPSSSTCGTSSGSGLPACRPAGIDLRRLHARNRREARPASTGTSVPSASRGIWLAGGAASSLTHVVIATSSARSVHAYSTGLSGCCPWSTLRREPRRPVLRAGQEVGAHVVRQRQVRLAVRRSCE